MILTNIDVVSIVCIMERVCLGAKECRRYCCALNDLTKRQETEQCEWPEIISGSMPSSENPDLVQRIALELGRVLKTANEIETYIATEGDELGIALSALEASHSARIKMWESYAHAAKAGRILTDIEVGYYTEQLDEVVEAGEVQLKAGGVGDKEIMLARAMHDRATLESHGLLFDADMNEIITQLCVNAGAGRSVLLIGDKGVAKTQAAKFVSGLFSSDNTPRLISGDGSTMKDEFIGKMTLSEQNGATVTTFKKGILTECMEEGVPLVIDEINLIDPAIAMRLQNILLSKPGDHITLQENEGETIEVQPGFCVFATANEASRRYQSRAALDPAFRDRFTVIPVAYPDGNTPIVQTNNPPDALTRLAFAQAVSPQGIASSRVSAKDAQWLARLAHASEQLYSKPASDVNGSGIGNAVAAIVDDDDPRLSDCITPRRMVEILRSVDEGLSPYVVSDGVRGVTYNAIKGMQHRSDRLVMFDLIRLLHDDPKVPFDAGEIKERLRI